MPPIRQLLITGVFALMLMFALIGFFGGYQYTNNIAMNQTLAVAYNSILGGTSSFASSYGVANLSSQAKSAGLSLQNASAFNLIGTAFQSLALVGRFIVTIPALFFALGNFVSQPLVAIGVPVGFAVGCVDLLIIMLIIMTVLSALFIFPI